MSERIDVRTLPSAPQPVLEGLSEPSGPRQLAHAQDGDAMPLDLYAQENGGLPFLAKLTGVEGLYHADDEIRSGVQDLSQLLQGELEARGLPATTAALEAVLKDYKRELKGLDLLTSYDRLEKLRSLARIYQEKRRIGGLLRGRHS